MPVGGTEKQSRTESIAFCPAQKVDAVITRLVNTVAVMFATGSKAR